MFFKREFLIREALENNQKLILIHHQAKFIYPFLTDDFIRNKYKINGLFQKQYVITKFTNLAVEAQMSVIVTYSTMNKLYRKRKLKSTRSLCLIVYGTIILNVSWVQRNCFIWFHIANIPSIFFSSLRFKIIFFLNMSKNIAKFWNEVCTWTLFYVLGI